MGDEPDLDPEINREFFESNLLQLDPALLTEAGIRCFERFFKVHSWLPLCNVSYNCNIIQGCKLQGGKIDTQKKGTSHG